MSAWPGGLPQYPALNGFTKVRDPNVVATNVAQGYQRRRKRYPTPIKKFNVTLPPITAAQLATLDTFYETTVNSGVDVWDWFDFSRSPAVAASFRFGLEGIQAHALTDTLFQVSFSLEMKNP